MPGLIGYLRLQPKQIRRGGGGKMCKCVYTCFHTKFKKSF